MSNPWLALDRGADPAERIRQVGRAHERFVAGEPVTAIRSVVADSWRRSAGAVTPDSTAPIELADGDLEGYRAGHPLARVLPIFRDLLGGLADDGDHLMAVCDAHGRLLWVEGTPSVLRAADSMNFVPGARWDEAHAGTNAPGTALAVDHPLQIFATEHFSRRVQPWTCSAAPIHDPRTGRILGAIDVTGGDHLANPHSLALVRAAALAAEAHLATLTPRRPTPSAPSAGTAASSSRRAGPSSSAAATARSSSCSASTRRGSPASSWRSSSTATRRSAPSRCGPSWPGCGTCWGRCCCRGPTGCARPR